MNPTTFNTTEYSENQVAELVKKQFPQLEIGFVVLKVSDKHYQNRLMPITKNNTTFEILDVQIGYPKIEREEEKIKQIKDLIVILQKHIS